MERNLPPRALVPREAPLDLGQPFHSATQPQAIQVHQGLFAAPAVNKMQEFSNVMEASLREKEGAGDDCHGHATEDVSASQCHRVKWTNDMVKLLVSIVSYIDDDIDTNHCTSSNGNKHAMLKRKGKWRLVSSTMTKRGYLMLPQKCEDKFNDLNKRYKRLTEILGRGTACQIVKKPALLEQVSLSGNLREEAKKHLRSKQLHYEEMCSYHNHNKTCLLNDPALQRSLHMALRSLGEQGKLLSDDNDEDVRYSNDLQVSAEDHRHHRVHVTKKLKNTHEGGLCASHMPEVVATDINRIFSEGTGGLAAEKNQSGIDAIQIKRDRLKVKEEVQKLEQSHLKWLRSRKEKDMELQKMKLENERMQLENDRLELKLKLKEIEMGIKRKTI
ncbi:unnamed protein product [Urochloa humidicola]